MNNLTAKKVAINCALKAGKILLEKYHKKIEYHMKSPKDYVTEVDIKAEKIIIKEIQKNFPEHNIYSEEAGLIDKKSEYQWYIDPLDGTHNYMHGVTPFGVSIALTKKTEVLIGVIYIPLMDEMYVGQKGKGATLNGKKIKVSNRKPEEAMVTWSTKLSAIKKKKLVEEISKAFQMIRCYGCASQNCAWIASGNADLMISHNLPPHDIAAGYCIMKEAGAKITNLSGKPANFLNKEFLISNKQLQAKAIEILARCNK